MCLFARVRRYVFVDVRAYAAVATPVTYSFYTPGDSQSLFFIILFCTNFAFSIQSLGIILSEPVRSNQGIVTAVGPGELIKDGSLKPIGLEKGQVVFLPEYGGVKIPNASASDDTEFILYREDEILAIVED